MNTALIVGGDRIGSLKQVLANHGIAHITHWPGRKVGDGKKVIPRDIKLIVLVTDWISHSFTQKIKQSAAKRDVRVIYTPNGSAALQARLKRCDQVSVMEGDYRHQSVVAQLPRRGDKYSTTARPPG